VSVREVVAIGDPVLRRRARELSIAEIASPEIRRLIDDRDGREREEVKRGLTAGTYQHEVDHLDGILFVDRADPRTFATWQQFDRHQRDRFVQRVTQLTKELES
jgi:peptide deformylase